jgi:hypothetical protein
MINVKSNVIFLDIFFNKLSLPTGFNRIGADIARWKTTICDIMAV